MIIFTSICANYAHKARTLAQSVRRYLPEARFFVCLTEREIPEAMAHDDCFDRIVLSREMWEGNFDRFIFKHAIVEASTAVKGQFFRWLMKTYPGEDSYIYLDPDCCVYGDFAELKAALKESPIVLCPHLLHPGNVDMELSSTAHGVYNLGFLAVNSSEEAHRMIDWWAERLYLFCYDDIARGIFTDQKWCDLVPCFFDVKILRHYGYDFAPWGLMGCKVDKRDGRYYVQDQPVHFVHYSGFGPVAEQCMQKWMGEEGQTFREMYDLYAVEHERNNADDISHTPWSYQSYHSGEKIGDEVRRRYRQDWDLMFSMEDPFDKSNRFFNDYFAAQDAAAAGAQKPGAILKIRLRNGLRILRDDGVAAFARKLKEKIAARMKPVK